MLAAPVPLPRKSKAATVKDRNKLMFEPTDDTSQDTDLDTFSDSFFEKTPEVKEEIKEEAKEEVTPEDVDTPAEDTDEDDQKDDNPDGDDEPEEKPKKVNRFQERINELTAKAREAERRAEELERKLSEPKTDDPKTVQRSEDDAPKPDDKGEDGTDKYPLGEFDPQYIRDLTRHTIQAEQKIARAEEEAAKTQRENQMARDQLQAEWVEKLAPMTEQYDDFVEKTIELETTFEGLDPQYGDYLAQTIKSLDHGPEVLYYFATHIDEAERFVKMGPLAATLALGEYNAMFKGQTKKETKVSNAPPPPQVNKGSNVRKTVAADTDDLDAFSEMFFPKKK